MSAASRVLRVAFAAGLIAFTTALAPSGLAASAPAASTPAAAASTVDLYQRIDEMHHTAWIGKDGLTGSLDSLAQTTDGYLWIGTSSGLFRFDGAAFERYRPLAGEFPGTVVNALLATREGGLWVGFTAGGVRGGAVHARTGPDRTGLGCPRRP